MNTVSQNGFSSPVNFSASISPNTANPPTVSFANNGQVPSSTTTGVVTTSTTTTAGTYTITFNGDGGGVSRSCSVQLIVNAAARGFTLLVSPNSVDVAKGNNATYTVTANCTGAFTGPVTQLSAASSFSGLSYSFSSTSVNCGASVTLTVSGTGSVPQEQLSTPELRANQTITVSGEGA